MSTIKDCCDHNTDPFGLAYIIPSVEGCQLCPLGKIMLKMILYVYNMVVIMETIQHLSI